MRTERHVIVLEDHENNGGLIVNDVCSISTENDEWVASPQRIASPLVTTWRQLAWLPHSLLGVALKS